MTTIDSLIDRTILEYFRSADEQPAIVFLNGSLNDSATSVTLNTSTLAVDEGFLLSPGALIEVGTELMLIRSSSVAGTAATLTVARGWQGSQAQSHANDVPVVISPDISRATVFNVMCDEIVGLWPEFWEIVTLEDLTISTVYTEVPEDIDQVQELWFLLGDDDTTDWRLGNATLRRNFPPSSTGKAIVVQDTPIGSTGHLIYRRRWARPTDPTTTLESLGIRDDWHDFMVMSAASKLVPMLDPQKLSVEWVSEALESELAPPGTPLQMARIMMQMASRIRAQRARAWRSEYKTTTRVNNPYRPWRGAN